MKFEKLGRFGVFCSDDHKFGTDAVLLADFASPKSGERMCEFGCGCGIITMLCCQKQADLSVNAVDIQSEAVHLARLSADKNGITDRVSVECADLRDFSAEHKAQFDLVVMNPPYKKAGAGLVSGNKARDIARFETCGTIDEIAFAAAEVLRYQGRFCICHRPERLGDAIKAMYSAGLTPKKLRTVSQNKNSRISLVLLEARNGGGDGMTVCPPLFIEDESERLFKDYFSEERRKTDV